MEHYMFVYMYFREKLYEEKLKQQQQELKQLHEERQRLMDIQGKIQDIQWACPDLQVLYTHTLVTDEEVKSCFHKWCVSHLFSHL